VGNHVTEGMVEGKGINRIRVPEVSIHDNNDLGNSIPGYVITEAIDLFLNDSKLSQLLLNILEERWMLSISLETTVEHDSYRLWRPRFSQPSFFESETYSSKNVHSTPRVILNHKLLGC
jgi:hypothetical protein